MPPRISDALTRVGALLMPGAQPLLAACAAWCGVTVAAQVSIGGIAATATDTVVSVKTLLIEGMFALGLGLLAYGAVLIRKGAKAEGSKKLYKGATFCALGLFMILVPTVVQYAGDYIYVGNQNVSPEDPYRARP